MRLNPAPGYGERIRRARLAAGFDSRDALGKVLGVVQSGISKWEHEVSPPDHLTALALEYLVGIPMAWVELGDEPMLVTPIRPAFLRALADGAEWRARADSPIGPEALPGYRLPPISGVGMGQDYENSGLIVGPQVKTLQRGRVYLMDAGRGGDTLSFTVGRAVMGPTGWLLYHDEDRGGTFPPHAVKRIALCQPVLALVFPPVKTEG